MIMLFYTFKVKITSNQLQSVYNKHFLLFLNNFFEINIIFKKTDLSSKKDNKNIL